MDKIVNTAKIALEVGKKVLDRFLLQGKDNDANERSEH